MNTEVKLAVLIVQELQAETIVGRVYVEDPDDWDLSDKRFEWSETSARFEEEFILDERTGSLIIRETAPANIYQLDVIVSFCYV